MWVNLLRLERVKRGTVAVVMVRNKQVRIPLPWHVARRSHDEISLWIKREYFTGAAS